MATPTAHRPAPSNVESPPSAPSAGPQAARTRGEREESGQAVRPRGPADDCVHCGFCLPHCPTYVSWGEEMDSPRGRIDLFRALQDGRLALDESVVRHFDRCLGCMGCVTACPSGVRYDVVIEQARAQIERVHRRPLLERLHRAVVFALFPHPARLRLAALLLLVFRVTGLRWILRRSGLLRLFSARLAQLEALAPDVGVLHVASGVPAHTPAQGERRLRVGLLAGCVQRVFFPGVNAATVRVLSAEGCDVVVPPRQGCCGALSLHAGREDEAKRMAQDLILRFEEAHVDVIAVNAAGCGSNMKDYGRILAGDPEWAARAAAVSARVKDVTELLASLEPRAERHAIPARVAYHSSCHLGHAQSVREPPRALLRGIPGLELVEIPEPEQCCGSAGVYNLFQVESASEIGRRKAENVLSTNADLLASANPGCTLHIQRLLRERGAGVRAAHPIEILDWSIRGVRGDGK
jgi:glycolate oxidase iron-sulfur subunit